MQILMVRYGEIFLKSESVRRHFLSVMKKNITAALESQNISHEISEFRGRILISCENPNEVAVHVTKIFGVYDISVATCTDNTIEALSLAASEYAEQHLHKGMSFAIRAKRDNVEGYTSRELGAVAGSAVLDKVPDATVDLTNPDYEIFLEARSEGGLAYDERLPGPGGLPFGTQGKIVSLLSAGIDSPVASWLMMKRGCKPVFLHIDSGNYGGDGIQKCTLSHLKKLSGWCLGTTLEMYSVDGHEFFDAVVNVSKPRYSCILCKRFMLETAALLAKNIGAEALVTGENLGQVASQTLINLKVLDSETDAAIFRPLLTYDKEEIIEKAKNIGTFIEKPGDTSCRVVPKHPVTSADQQLIAGLEKEINLKQKVESAVSGAKLIRALNREILPVA